MQLSHTAESKNHDSYSHDDIFKWISGADRFRNFWSDIKYSLKEEQFDEYRFHRTSPFFASDIGSLEALFLGEKPSASICRSYLDDNLRTYGFFVSPKFYFDKAEIFKIMQKYRCMYTELDRSSPHDVMDFLSDQAFHDSHTEIGLVLGYPHEACEAYSKRNPAAVIEKLIRRCIKVCSIDFDDMDLKQIIEFFLAHEHDLSLSQDEYSALEKCYFSLLRGRPLNNFARVSVYGVSWEEYGIIDETSRKVQHRLRAAFEMSGILDVFNPATFNGNGKSISRYYPAHVL